MRKAIVVLFLHIFPFSFFCQEIILPEDYRQHSLTQFNASLWNATYSLDWNNPKSISLWTRWQWQTIDSDPTSLFLNYTHSFNNKTSAGLGFLQHNTGTFLNTGGILNVAQSITIKENIKLIVGANVYLFQQKVADIRFNPDIDVSEIQDINDFITQFSPGIRLNINQFNIGASLENAIDYNFSQNQTNINSKVFVGTVSNDFFISLFPSMGVNTLRPVLYIKSIPNYDTQLGGNILFNTSKFWIQGGFNSFYGPSGGLGTTLFNSLSIGGLVEFGSSNDLANEDLTFELVASYHFGKANLRKKVVDFENEEEEEISQEKLKNSKDKKEKLGKNTKKKKSKKEVKAEIKAQEELDRIEEEKERKRKLLEQEAMKRRMDSINLVKEKEIALLRERTRLDSIAKLERTKEVEVLPNEKYEEVTSTTIEGLKPGFYLIANVFGTKRYFDAFMQSMTSKGLEPKSFYRAKNKFNYVYLGKYNTIEEARKARNSKLNGKYEEKTWIFRVRE